MCESVHASARVRLLRGLPRVCSLHHRGLCSTLVRRRLRLARLVSQAARTPPPVPPPPPPPRQDVRFLELFFFLSSPPSSLSFTFAGPTQDYRNRSSYGIPTKGRKEGRKGAEPRRREQNLGEVSGGSSLLLAVATNVAVLYVIYLNSFEMINIALAHGADPSFFGFEGIARSSDRNGRFLLPPCLPPPARLPSEYVSFL